MVRVPCNRSSEKSEGTAAPVPISLSADRTMKAVDQADPFRKQGRPQPGGEFLFTDRECADKIE
ncbi:MAG: hypothetical protein K8F29_06110 [Kofleriaceae bacterium]|nr:hypothetical protein [Candidatus Methylomirabilis lanthanidiphila]